MIRKIGFLVVMMSGVGSTPALAEHHSAFDKMKQMVGTWEGKLTRVTGEVVDTRSEFRLISGGNTMVETLIEDGVEMLTTYTEHEGDLVGSTIARSERGQNFGLRRNRSTRWRRS